MREFCDPFYRYLCHQLPERSYAVAGERLPVCARCVGVWLGLAVMAVVAALAGLWRLRTGLILVGCMVASWALRLPEGWHAERTITGAAGGMGLVVIAGRGWGMARRAIAKSRAVWERLVGGGSGGGSESRRGGA